MKNNLAVSVINEKFCLNLRHNNNFITVDMKANLFNEVEAPVEPVDEHKLAVAEEKPEKIDAPKPTYYIVNYKTLAVPSLIALAIFVVWAVATWLL